MRIPDRLERAQPTARARSSSPPGRHQPPDKFHLRGPFPMRDGISRSLAAVIKLYRIARQFPRVLGAKWEPLVLAPASPRTTWSDFLGPPTPTFYCEVPSLSPSVARNMPNAASDIVRPSSTLGRVQ